MRCEKCGQEMSLGRKYFFCEDCEIKVPIEVDQEPWNRKLSADSEYWYQEAFDEFPYVIAYEYKRLKIMLESGETYGSMLQLKDVFEVSLKFPMLIILEGCIRQVEHLIHTQCFSVEKMNKDYRNIQSILEILLGKLISLGDWEQMAHLARKLKADEHLPAENSNIYNNTIKLISRIMDNYKYKFGDMKEDTNISSWRNNSIGHGALAFDDDPFYQEEFKVLLKTLKGIMMVSSNFYKNMKLLTDSKIVLEGVNIDKSVLASAKYYIIEQSLGDGGKESLVLEPYMIHTDEKSYLFDSFDPRKRIAYVLNYSHGKKAINKMLKNRLEALSQNMRIAAVSSASIYDANLDKRDIEAFEKLMYEKEILKPAYMHDWLEQSLMKDGKGVYMLMAERGMGKTVFTNAVDDLDNCRYKDGKSKLNGTMVRVWHFNSTYSSRIDRFKAGLVDLLRTWKEAGRAGESIIRTGMFSGEIDIRCSEFITSRKKHIEDMKRELANLLEFIKLQYNIHGYKVDKLLVILDGLDEINSAATIDTGDTGYDNEYIERYGNLSIFDYIPEPDMLADGIYLLLTTRTIGEISDNKYVSERINNLKVSDTIKVLRDDMRYKQCICTYMQEYVFKNFSGNIEQANHEIQQMMNNLEYRFVYASVYRKLYESTKGIELGKGENVLSAFLKKIRDSGEAYYREVLNLLLICALSNEQLSLREIAWLMGNETVTYKMMAMLKDIGCFLEFKRNSRGSLISLSHFVWRKELLNEYRAEITEVTQGLVSKIGQFYELVKSKSPLDGANTNLSEEMYDGVTWLLANIFDFLNNADGISGREELLKDIVNMQYVLLENMNCHNRMYILQRIIKIITGIIDFHKGIENIPLSKRIKLLYLRGRSNRFLSKYSEALEDLNLIIGDISCGTILDLDTETANHIVKSFINRSECFIKLMEWDSAIENDTAAIEFFTKTFRGTSSYYRELAMLYNSRGMTYLTIGQLASALPSINKAVSVLKKAIADENQGYSEEMAMFYNNRGYIYLKQNNISKALKDFEKAEKLRESQMESDRKVDRRRELVIVYINKALAYRDKHDFYTSEVYVKKALEMIQSLQKSGVVEDEEAFAQYVYGSILAGSGRYDEAIRYLDTALSYREANKKYRYYKSIWDIALILRERGYSYECKGLFSEAYSDFTESLNLLDEFLAEGRLFYKLELIKALYLRGRLLLEHNDINEALSDIDRAISFITVLCENGELFDSGILLDVYMCKIRLDNNWENNDFSREFGLTYIKEMAEPTKHLKKLLDYLTLLIGQAKANQALLGIREDVICIINKISGSNITKSDSGSIEEVLRLLGT